jgi:predicted anti-sigma-YlaC factor YlaD
MHYWNEQEHLTDLALELRAADELEAARRPGVDEHLRRCPACRARAGEWDGLVRLLRTLPRLEPSATFDEAVMARLRLPTHATSRMPAWMPGLLRGARRVAVAAAAVWSALVTGTALWFGTRLEVSAADAFGNALAFAPELLWTVVIRITAILQLTGLTDALAGAGALPRTTVAGVIALMTAASGLALWTLYRISELEPIRIRMNAHV